MASELFLVTLRTLRQSRSNAIRAIRTSRTQHLISPLRLGARSFRSCCAHRSFSEDNNDDYTTKSRITESWADRMLEENKGDVDVDTSSSLSKVEADGDYVPMFEDDEDGGEHDEPMFNAPDDPDEQWDMSPSAVERRTADLWSDIRNFTREEWGHAYLNSNETNLIPEKSDRESNRFISSWRRKNELQKPEDDNVTGHKKPRCLFCMTAHDKPRDFEPTPPNVPILLRFMSSYGYIRPRKATGLCAKHQRKLAKAIRRARHLGFFTHRKSEYVINIPFPELSVEQDYFGRNRVRNDAYMRQHVHSSRNVSHDNNEE